MKYLFLPLVFGSVLLNPLAAVSQNPELCARVFEMLRVQKESIKGSFLGNSNNLLQYRATRSIFSKPAVLTYGEEGFFGYHEEIWEGNGFDAAVQEGNKWILLLEKCEPLSWKRSTLNESHAIWTTIYGDYDITLGAVKIESRYALYFDFEVSELWDY